MPGLTGTPRLRSFISAKDAARAAASSDLKGPDGAYTQTANVQVAVTFTPDLFKDQEWHDGANFSMGDMSHGHDLTFDPGKKDSKIYDVGYETSTFATFMSHFKGVKIVSTDPLTITTWDDKFQLNAESSAVTWYPSYGCNGIYAYGTGSWSNLTPAILAEEDGKMAFSLAKSSGAKIDRDQPDLRPDPAHPIPLTWTR